MYVVILFDYDGKEIFDIHGLFNSYVSAEAWALRHGGRFIIHELQEVN